MRKLTDPSSKGGTSPRLHTHSHTDKSQNTKSIKRAPSGRTRTPKISMHTYNSWSKILHTRKINAVTTETMKHKNLFIVFLLLNFE